MNYKRVDVFNKQEIKGEGLIAKDTMTQVEDIMFFLNRYRDKINQ